MAIDSAIMSGYKQTEIGIIPNDWIVKTFRDVVEKFIDYRGVTPKKLGMNWGNGDICALSANNVQMGYIDFNKECYLASFQLYKRWMRNGDCEKDDILITMEAPLGNIAFIPDDKKYILSQRVVLIRPLKFIEKNFLRFLMTGTYFQKCLTDNASGSTAQGIQRKRLEGLSVYFPNNKSEQLNIAAILSDNDSLIKNFDELIAKKKAIKQGTIQQILTGKKRLPGFSGVWEVKKLGEIGKCYRGVSYNPNTDLFGFDKEFTFRLLRSNNVQERKIIYSDMQFVDSKRVSNTQILRKNDILICMANGSKDLVGKAGQFHMIDGYKYTFGAFMGCFRPGSISVDHNFIFYLFQTEKYRSHISLLLAGSSINNLCPSSIDNFSIFIPKELAEQTAISTILSDMDNEIEELEKKRNKYFLIKQGMMQQLLTGKIRVYADK